MALSSVLGGCAVYSTSPHATVYTSYSTGVYSGGGNIALSPSTIIIDSYPDYRYINPQPIYNYPYNQRYHYHPAPKPPPQFFTRPGFNRDNPPGTPRDNKKNRH